VLDPAARDEWRTRTAWAIAAGRFLAAFDGTRQVGGAYYHDMLQWWNGRCLPTSPSWAAPIRSVLLEMADEALGENGGGWMLTVEGGKGHLERA
jgi:hypothetical protein